MKSRIRTKTYICGNYKHIFFYPVFSTSSRRKKRYKPTTLVQAEINSRRAEKRLEMLLETNFDEKDCFFTATYRSDLRPKTDEKAMKQARNFIRRIQYQCKRKGLDAPVAVWCTELSKDNKLYHHHFVIKSGLNYDELAKIWGKGRTSGGKLHFDVDGMSGLAKYLPKEPIGAVRYHSTKNLKQPLEQQNDNTSIKEFNKIFEQAFFHLNNELAEKYPEYNINDNSLTAYESFVGCRFVYIKLCKKRGKTDGIRRTKSPV